ncbi:MAG: response regulator [Deinococcus sp.]|nr:response regulator [Deinococcus sp.]
MTADQIRRSILLVDDDANDRELAQIVFSELATESGAQADVRILAGGQEALDFLDRHAGRPEQLPDVVLLDLNMPQIDGLSVLKAIRQNPATTTLPVVILSTSRERADVQRAYALGANAYVVKPLDYDHFHRTISSVLDFWTGQNQVNR